MKRIKQLSDSSSDNEDDFEDVPNKAYNYYPNKSGLPGYPKRAKRFPSSSSVPVNEEESDNQSSTSERTERTESDHGYQTAKRDQRSTSHQSEDSTAGSSVFFTPFYAKASERPRTISQDTSERESNDEDIDNQSTSHTGMGYYSGPSERERTGSQDSELDFQSNDEDNRSTTSASFSDLDTKPHKNSFDEDVPFYNPRSGPTYYGSNEKGSESDSKNYESNDDEAEKLSNALANSSNRHAKLNQNDRKLNSGETSSYTPKNRFVKSDSCDTAQSSSASEFSSFEGKRKSESTDSEDELLNLPAPKKSKSLASIKTSGAVSKMMAKMGYASGKGLGKHAQGVVEPIKLSSQRGRRGLGAIMVGFEAEDVPWDFDQEKVEVVENVDWLECHDDQILMLKPPNDIIEKLKSIEDEKKRKSATEKEKRKTLIGGLKVDKKKMTLDDEDHFCDRALVKRVMKHKTAFDELPADEMRRARDRSNPFESIKGGMFLNRAAMKMANMDKRFDFMFTKPVDQNGEPTVGDNELLYFADVCAGPGGFSEYVLWRKKWKAKGFGLTLKASNDFKLDDFYAGPCESFEAHYGANDDGNIYTPANMESFKNLIFEQTKNEGVHFMMADGGFSVEGQENIQEILSKQLYLCQCLVALLIVRTGGHFVTKLFDLFTPFSVGIIYLMHQCFDKICIFKPNTSRPANSERYLVCKWKREEAVIQNIRIYLENINKEFFNLQRQNEVGLAEAKERAVEKAVEKAKKRALKEARKQAEEAKKQTSKAKEEAKEQSKSKAKKEGDKSEDDSEESDDDSEESDDEFKEKDDEFKEKDVVEIVLLDKLKSDENFYQYILKSNNELARRQIVNLKKVVAFVKNSNLTEFRQKDLKEQCLKYWEVPDTARSAPKIPGPSSKQVLSPIFGMDAGTKMPTPSEISKKGHLVELSKSFSNIYDWHCVSLQDHEKTTLFYGQGRRRVHKWEGSGWTELPAESMLELSPKSVVYGELVYEFVGEGKGLRKSCAFHIIDAFKLGNEDIGEKKYSERYKLCKLFCKAMTRRECPVRMKPLHELYEVKDILHHGLVRKQLKNISIHRLCYPIPPFHFEVNSLLFMSSTAHGWARHWSNNKKLFYYYNWLKKESKFEHDANPETFTNFASMMKQLKVWSWKNYPESQPPTAVSETFIKFLKEKSVHNRQ